MRRIAVGSDQALVAESIVAALRHRSYEAIVVRWPQPLVDASPRPRRRRGGRRPLGPPPDAGLVVSDLSRMSQVRSAQALVTGLPVPWVVMAGTDRGPAWGALYESGVTTVVPNTDGLDRVCRLLDDLADGKVPPRQPRRQRELVARWRRFASRRSELVTRVRSLTDREEEVLQQLHDGLAVRLIAERSEVTEATVRSHVQAILKKLDVTTQMAAVAAYDGVLTDSTLPDDLGEPSPKSGMSPP